MGVVAKRAGVAVVVCVVLGGLAVGGCSNRAAQTQGLESDVAKAYQDWGKQTAVPAANPEAFAQQTTLFAEAPARLDAIIKAHPHADPEKVGRLNSLRGMYIGWNMMKGAGAGKAGAANALTDLGKRIDSTWRELGGTGGGA